MEVRHRVPPLNKGIGIPSRLSSRINSESSETSSFISDPPISFAGIWHWIVLFGILLVCFIFIPLMSLDCISSYRSQSTEENASYFQEKFARKHLRYVTGLGPRPCGSLSNEIHAPKYLISELKNMMDAAKSSALEASLDEQISQPSSFKTHAHITSYANLRNILFRLHDPRSDSSKNKSVLVNCHYDSAPNSPGASDAFVSCANALEVIRALIHSAPKMINDVVFLFNSAEEAILPASHAFITQHEWAADVAAFVNLEGAGAGGKLLVFQSGPGPSSALLVESYATAVTQPAASVIGEEIFQFGLIPSDTDFRIFRDYGRLPGLDLAYISNGYCYHTRNDVEERISEDCLQLAGDNLLELVKIMASSSKISEIKHLETKWFVGKSVPEDATSTEGQGAIFGNDLGTSRISDSTRYVYFDILGVFLLKYPWYLGRILHLLVCIYCLVRILTPRRLASFGRSSYSGLILALLIQLLLFFSSFMFMAAVGLATHLYGCRMSWYTNRYNIFGVFLMPLITFCTFFHTSLFKLPHAFILTFSPFRQLLKRSGWVSEHAVLGSRFIENDIFHANLLLLNFPLLILLYIDSPASFIFASWCLLVVISRFAFAKLPKILTSSKTLEALATILPATVVIQAHSSALIFEVFIPIFGRSGHLSKPDLTVALIVHFVSLPFFLFLSSLLHFTSARSAKVMRLFLLNACITFAVLVHTSSIGFPYAIIPGDNAHLVSPSQQRVAVFHSNRNFREDPLTNSVTYADSGIFLIPADPNGFRYFHHAPSTALSTSPFLLRLRQMISYGVNKEIQFPELFDLQQFTCRRDHPYCGIPLLYPILHAFNQLYYFPAKTRHQSPSAELNVITKQISHRLGSEFDRLVNFTIEITSPAPNTQILLNVQPEFVRLLNWSFASEVGRPNPMPMPGRTQFENSSIPSAHYFINHFDPSSTVHPSGRWQTPLVFWVQFAMKSQQPMDYTNAYTRSVDFALVCQYSDTQVSHGKSIELDNMLSRMPGFAVPISWISSYDHWRISVV